MEEKKIAAVKRNDQLLKIEIYSFENMNFQGLFSNALYGADIFFENLMVLLMLMEDCMNKIAFPQAVSCHRKLKNVRGIFSRNSHSARDAGKLAIPEANMPEIWKYRNPEATFLTRIIFRIVSGWQGEIESVETGNKKIFKSDFECVKFMVNELRTAEKSDRTVC